MKRRFISILLAVAIFVSLMAGYIPTASADDEGHFGAFGTEYTALRWQYVLATKTLRIFPGTGAVTPIEMPNLTATNAPWIAYSGDIENLVIESGITEIGDYTFYDCISLVNVDAPDVVRIGNNAFQNCSLLETIDFTTAMPGLEVIGDFAFRGCEELEELNFPDSLRVIGFGVFIGCRKLETFTFPFQPIPGGPYGNNYFTIDNDGVLIWLNVSGIATRIIKAPAGIDEYTIASTIVIIEPYAFAHSELEVIRFPQSVLDIGEDAFAHSPLLMEAYFDGNAPRPVAPWGSKIFGTPSPGFQIFYLPYRTGWPTPPSTNWRDNYTAIAISSYVTLDRSDVILELGNTTRLVATVYPSNASQVVTWTSTNPAVASVSLDGIVLAVSTGITYVTATSVQTGQTRSARIEVVGKVVSVTSVALDHSDLTLYMDGSMAGESAKLSAVVYPVDATNKKLTWSSSNNSVAYVDLEAGLDINFQRVIVPVAAGTATITVRTEDGNRVATCLVTVIAQPRFVPVTNITIATTTIATGATMNLGATVYPANATNRFLTVGGIATDIPNLVWEVIDQTTVGSRISNGIDEHPGGELTIPMGQMGTVTVQATVPRGLADRVDWGFPADVDFVQTFVINVVSYIPVTNVKDVPDIGFAGIPLQLTGTVEPVGASFKNIEWKLGGVNTAGARVDEATGVLLAQWPGMVSVIATVRNGLMQGTALGNYSHTFSIRIDPYVTNRLELTANPGGRVSGAGAGLFAGGEKVTITAIPDIGYNFAGWYTSNGGEFANDYSPTTVFTMPRNETRVTAFFTFTGIPGSGSGGAGGGGVVLPVPVHYFTSSSVYTRNSGVSFGHVTIRDFSLFSNITLNGSQLTRNSHYTANRLGGFTEIILSNGYMDSLNPGSHSLTVNFRDNVAVTAVFTVVWPSQTTTVYDDVDASNWFASSVAFVSDRGWMTARPTEPRRFRPSSPVTQGEVIDAFYKMAGNPTIMGMSGQALQGRDAAHQWVRDNGIVPLGGVFYLDSPITRQDIALLFGRFVTAMRLTYPVNRAAPTFSDEWQIEPAARPAVISLYRANVISGRTEYTFVPLGQMTRAETASMLQRFATSMGRW